MPKEAEVKDYAVHNLAKAIFFPRNTVFLVYSQSELARLNK